MRCESRIVGGVVAALLFASEGLALDAPAPVVEKAVRLFAGQRLSNWSGGSGLGIADLDGDGLDDAAVGTQNGILLLKGAESGAFTKVRRIGDDRIGRFGLADFDNDGYVDLLTYRSSVLALESHFGQGGFDFHDPRAVSASSEVATIADFTNDGLVDILLYDGILIAKSDRTFDQRDINFHGYVEWVGDLASNGILDAVTFSSGELFFFFGNGDGTFTRGPQFDSRQNIANAVTFADIDEDGDLELLLITWEGELRVYDPTGPLVFDPDSYVTYATRPEGFPVNPSPAQILVADLDQDSILDIGVANYTRSDVSILFGRAGGGFEQAILYGTSAEPRKLVLTRIGQDESSIGVVVDANGGPFVITSRELRERTPQRVLLHAENPFNPTSIALGDIDGDGNQDIAAIGGSGANDGSIIVFFGTEEPGVTVPVTIDGGASPRLLRVEDLTGDGFDDIIVARAEMPFISVLRGGADRDGVGTIVWSGGFSAAASSDELHLADLNRDSHLDLIVAGLNRSHIKTLLGAGDGSFVEGETFGTVDDSPGKVAVADFDGDGVLDLATGTARGHVVVRIGDGAGGAGQPIEFATGSQRILALVAADANGDGRIDIVYVARATSGTHSIGTILNVGQCAGDCNQDGKVTINELTTGVRRLLGLDDEACAVLDLDGDGLVVISDLIRAVRNALHGCPASAASRGGATQPTFLFETPGLTTLVEDSVFATTIRVADIDRDGALDVVGTHNRGLGLAFGRGDGSFESPVWYGKGSGDLALELADYDGDGRLDIVTTNSSRLGDRGTPNDPAVVIMLQNASRFGAAP